MMNIADRKIAAVELPGIPSDRAGISAPAEQALLATSAAMIPSSEPWPNFSFLLGGALGKIVGKPASGRLADARDEANPQSRQSGTEHVAEIGFQDRPVDEWKAGLFHGPLRFGSAQRVENLSKAKQP